MYQEVGIEHPTLTSREENRCFMVSINNAEVNGVDALVEGFRLIEIGIDGPDYVRLHCPKFI
jgi:hypothetical protein